MLVLLQDLILANCLHVSFELGSFQRQNVLTSLQDGAADQPGSLEYVVNRSECVVKFRMDIIRLFL